MQIYRFRFWGKIRKGAEKKRGTTDSANHTLAQTQFFVKLKKIEHAGYTSVQDVTIAP
jgi:hypothetical protein